MSNRKGLVHGHCDPRFGKVEEIFSESFRNGTEIGAAVSFTLDGESVVDLWGGHKDRALSDPWDADTLVNVYSTTKGMTAICAHQLIEKGLLDVSAPVAHYWPEFAAEGKEKLPVHYLLSHRAGLPAVRDPLPESALYDWNKFTAALAAQEPWWEPGTRHGYHALTFGHLVGELIRRISGQTVGQYFQEHVAKPLDADFHIGVGPEFDSRISDLHGGLASPDSGGQRDALPEPIRQFMRDMSDPTTMTGAAFNNPPVAEGVVNSRAWRQAEIPAANGHATARSLARIYGALSRGGEVDGIRILRPETLDRAITQQADGPDAVLGGMPMRFGLGFMLRSMVMPLSPSPRAFGHPGAGGSLGMADPDAGVGFGYTMNRMKPGLVGGASAFAMLGAFFDAL
ncbi:MAG: serine hydrolase domain-containing protein [Myxococcota bacterium]|nr:EstA family serine hydrolase [Spirochaeta sp.]RPG07210.1 MAG: class A beta-lactamase-related serine hydrolase [Proteobacteria bacterium TMED72]